MTWSAEELVYCSNVHPGERLPDIETVLDHFIGPVRQRRGLRYGGAGLWLGASVADQLDRDLDARAALRESLQRNHIRLFTLNGFPVGGFHADQVKEMVYAPDWSSEARFNYTAQLARVLADLMPDDLVDGTISTLPLGYRPHWTGAGAGQAVAMNQICRLASELSELRAETGKQIRVCLEMEPGCALETTTEAIEFLSRSLPQWADSHGTAVDTIRDHIGVCYDVCHQAVMFEDPLQSLAAFQDAGVMVGKIQISSALHVDTPHSKPVKAQLEQFAEPRYLHQVRCRDDLGIIHETMDLPDALAGADFPAAQPWRIHFHVPVQSYSLCMGELGTTQGEIGRVLDFLAGNPQQSPHLEIETYTWQVLPPALRPGNDDELVDGLTAELAWLQQQLDTRGLLRA